MSVTRQVARAQVADRSVAVCVLAAKPGDAVLTCAHLAGAGVDAFHVDSFDGLLAALRSPVGALMLTEDAMPAPRWGELALDCERQPAWADLPIIVFSRARQAGLDSLLRTGIGNITVIETPVRVSTVVSAAQAALRARRRQYEVRDLLARLEETDRRKDEFLAMLGHELRNPLAAMQLALQVRQLQSPAINDRSTEVLHRQLRNLGRIVDDLLDVSRVTLGKIQLERTHVDIVDAARRCVQALSHEAVASKLRLDIDAGAPSLFVYADAVRVEQVLANLVTNAIKYTPAGGAIRVSVAAVPGGRVRVAVGDTGIGIEPGLVESLFDLFTQAQQGLDRSRGGLGLGLALVKQLVELHQGSVGATSDGVGKGSTFWFELPRTSPQEAMPEPTAEPHSPLRILVVEDNQDARDLLEDLLEDAGHEVQTAADGLAGLRAALDGDPDVLLLDIGLPTLSGYEVAQEVRRSTKRQPHMIAMTGYGQPADRERALAAGFDLFVVKPIDLVGLQHALARCAEQRRREPIG